MTPKRFFFVMLGLMILVIGLGVSGFWFGDQQLKKQSTSLADLTAERDAAQKKLEDLQRLSNTPINQTETENLIKAILPADKQQQNLIANIINTAVAEAGIPSNRISNITFAGSGAPSELSGATQSKEVPGVYSYPFTVVIRDISYETLLKLFTEIEKNKRIIQADQVQINPNKAVPGQLSSVTLSLKTFIKP